jgi:Uma2 family endonuclease
MHRKQGNRTCEQKGGRGSCRAAIVELASARQEPRPPNLAHVRLPRHRKAQTNDLLEWAEPAWDVAKLFPAQGQWSTDEYLALQTNQLVEFIDGRIEVLPMPTEVHQFIVIFLFDMLRAFARRRKLGTPLLAPFRVRLHPRKFREPDVIFMLAEHADRRKNQYWDRADLVMEVVSEDDRQRDFDFKRREYALAGIPEYWIVDPQRREITVLSLRGKTYKVHGAFGRGQRATSVLLKGFGLSVTAAFKAGDAGKK